MFSFAIRRAAITVFPSRIPSDTRWSMSCQFSMTTLVRSCRPVDTAAKNRCAAPEAVRGADSSAPEEEACLTEDEEEYWEDASLQEGDSPLDEPPESGTWNVCGAHKNRTQTECGSREKSICQQQKANAAGACPTPSQAHAKQQQMHRRTMRLPMPGCPRSVSGKLSTWREGVHTRRSRLSGQSASGHHRRGSVMTRKMTRRGSLLHFIKHRSLSGATQRSGDVGLDRRPRRNLPKTRMIHRRTTCLPRTGREASASDRMSSVGEHSRSRGLSERSGGVRLRTGTQLWMSWRNSDDSKHGHRPMRQACVSNSKQRRGQAVPERDDVC